jgi:polar amino acid transport system substrate-binding protein
LVEQPSFRCIADPGKMGHDDPVWSAPKIGLNASLDQQGRHSMKSIDFRAGGPGMVQIFAAIVAAGILWPSSAAQTATLEEIQKRGYMVVATEDDYPPFEFVKDGKPQGLDHELTALLKDYAKFEIRQQILPWQGLLAGVATGKYDIAISAAVITEERSKSLDFTMPIAEGTHYYVKRKGDTRIMGVKDLSGKVVGVQQGSALYAGLPELEEMLKKTGGKLGSVVQYASYPEAYQDLVNKRLDYVINTVVTVSSLVRERPDVFEAGEAVSQRAYHAWAVKKGNKELLTYINGFLAEQRKAGNMTKLQEKWLGRAFPDMPMEAKLPGDRPMPN